MLKQCLAVVALSALPVGYGLTLCAAPAASSTRLPAPAGLSAHLESHARAARLPRVAAASAPQVAAPARQPQPPVSRTIDPEQPIHMQMRVLDRVARMDMLLYTGHLAPVHHASIQHLRHVTALSLSGVAGTD